MCGGGGRRGARDGWLAVFFFSKMGFWWSEYLIYLLVIVLILTMSLLQSSIHPFIHSSLLPCFLSSSPPFPRPGCQPSTPTPPQAAKYPPPQKPATQDRLTTTPSPFHPSFLTSFPRLHSASNDLTNCSVHLDEPPRDVTVLARKPRGSWIGVIDGVRITKLEGTLCT